MSSKYHDFWAEASPYTLWIVLAASLAVASWGLWAQPAPPIADPIPRPPAEVRPPGGEPPVLDPPEHMLFPGHVRPEREPEEEPSPPRGKAEVLKARMVGVPGHRHVQEVRPWKRDGGRMDWSRQGDQIVYDRLGEDGRHDLWVAPVNGVGEKCLTCDHYDFRKLSCLDPAWHPSGEYVVFMVRDTPRRFHLDTGSAASPERGLHSELWTLTADGRQYAQITKVRENGGAVLSPHFSYEADRLMWSERLSSKFEKWGDWGVRVAEFELKRGLPRLGKVRTLEPGSPGLRLGHGFTPNDRGAVISASFGPPGDPHDRDILLRDLEGGAIQRLTSSPGDSDELASFAPRGDRIVWVSSRSQERGRLLTRRHDLWVMQRDGSGQERLTFFNDPASNHFLGEVLIDDLAWSPQGDRLLVHLVQAHAEGGSEAIYQIVFSDHYRR